MARLDITEVSNRSGLPSSTLRYYEQRGLIESRGRHGGRRQFDEEVIEQLALISLGQASGFSLDEIATMFGPNGEPCIDRTALRAKADQLDRKIRRLSTMRDGLIHASQCPAPSHMECESFRGLVALAGAGELVDRQKQRRSAL